MAMLVILPEWWLSSSLRTLRASYDNRTGEISGKET